MKKNSIANKKISEDSDKQVRQAKLIEFHFTDDGRGNRFHVGAIIPIKDVVVWINPPSAFINEETDHYVDGEARVSLQIDGWSCPIGTLDELKERLALPDGAGIILEDERGLPKIKK